MAVSVGTDIIEIQRIHAVIERHGERFLKKLYSAKEIEYCQKHQYAYRNFAGRFAGKEAVVKALGTGFGKDYSFLDIEILNESTGKPVVYIKGEKRDDIALSISHCKEYATATAIYAALTSNIYSA